MLDKNSLELEILASWNSNIVLDEDSVELKVLTS